MTTIDRLGGTGRPASVGLGRPAQSGAAGFALPEAETKAGQSESIAGAAPPALLGAMLLLQEAEADRARDLVARRHSEAVLTALRALQVGLLGGAARGAALRHLAGLAARLPEAADPALGMLVRAVALRAEVELARGTGDQE